MKHYKRYLFAVVLILYLQHNLRLTEIETTENMIDYKGGFVVLQLLKINLYVSPAYPFDTFIVDLSLVHFETWNLQLTFITFVTKICDDRTDGSLSDLNTSAVNYFPRFCIS